MSNAINKGSTSLFSLLCSQEENTRLFWETHCWSSGHEIRLFDFSLSCTLEMNSCKVCKTFTHFPNVHFFVFLLSTMKEVKWTSMERVQDFLVLSRCQSQLFWNYDNYYYYIFFCQTKLRVSECSKKMRKDCIWYKCWHWLSNALD